MAGLSIVEYGIGNIQSAVNACRRVGADPKMVRSGAELLARGSTRIMLPGVGAIGEAMANLRERRLDEALRRRVIDDGVPFLGICVGMQMLGEVCEEFGEHRGLGWIPGRVRRLAPVGSGLRLPHVGWNTIEVTGADPLLADLNGEHFYFQHSYALQCGEEYVLARTDYGEPFVSAVRKGHITGVQFHPEKSSTAGARLLAAFLAE